MRRSASLPPCRSLPPRLHRRVPTPSAIPSQPGALQHGATVLPCTSCSGCHLSFHALQPLLAPAPRTAAAATGHTFQAPQLLLGSSRAPSLRLMGVRPRRLPCRTRHAPRRPPAGRQRPWSLPLHTPSRRPLCLRGVQRRGRGALLPPACRWPPEDLHRTGEVNQGGGTWGRRRVG